MECARPTYTPSLLEKVWAPIDFSVGLGERGGGHNRTSRHVRTPLYRPRGVISGFEIVLHGVILPPLPLFARAGRINYIGLSVKL